MKTFTTRITQVPGKEERGDGAEITAFFLLFIYLFLLCWKTFTNLESLEKLKQDIYIENHA